MYLPTGFRCARSTSARTSRARSCAGPPTSPPATRWRWRFPARCCPTARCCARPSCAARSDGMMLSERELELSNEHDGIMRAPGDWPVGDPLIEHLAIADDVIEFEITSNRPDCQSVYGIAREVSAVLDTDLAPWPGIEPERDRRGHDRTTTSRRASTRPTCARAGRRGSSPTSRWARRRRGSRRASPRPGMRSISNVVDITNYVMLAPWRAHPRVRPRQGRRPRDHRAPRDRGEQVTTLDGQDRDPRPRDARDRRRREAVGDRRPDGSRSGARSPTRPPPC